MAENTTKNSSGSDTVNNTGGTIGNTGGTANAGLGAGVSSGSTATGNAGGGKVVAAPTDAKPGEVQGGDAGSLNNLGAADAVGAQSEQPAQQPGSAGMPLRVTVKGHTHAGAEVKKGQTIALSPAEYRWALENKIGEPGSADDVGYDVDKSGVAMKPQADDEAIAALEAKFNEKKSE